MTFPAAGLRPEQISERLADFAQLDFDRDKVRLLTGIHRGTEQVHTVCRDAYLAFFHENSLLAGMQEGQGEMQRQVLAATTDLFNGGPDATAFFTSGGSESIFTAIHTAREWARAGRPDIRAPYNIVMPRTCHATFDKGAHFLGVEVRRVPVGADLRANVAAMRAAINEHTLMLVGSAPCWGLGLVDPVAEIAALAAPRALWVHVDACVGGFLLPFMERLGERIPAFDFRVPGVCSISADLHKHGFAAKPASTVSFRSAELAQHHWTGTIISDWQCPGYHSQGVLGSRPASALAAAWAVIHHLGMEGYVEITRRSLEIKRYMVERIEAIEDFRVLGNECLLVPFRSETLDMHALLGGMIERGYFPWGTFDPLYVHPSAEPVEIAVVDALIDDIAGIAAGVRAGRITATALAKYV
jgi:glutamate/tyrosine decarboxylase-like PLP-dependent enzyme